MRRTRLPDWRGIRLAALWGVHKFGLPAGLAHSVLLGSVGAGTRIARGSCVMGRKARIGRDVNIGRRTDIVAEVVDIEDGVHVGDDVKIHCRTLVLRKGSQIGDRSVVYGILTPNSGLELGEHAWIYPDCHINTDERVTIGARSAAGSHCLVFTHSSYLPITQGYPVTIAPVTIGEDAWLPWHAFILPGARIGRGATVGAFSLVGGEVPEYCLAVGVPARVVKDAATYRRTYSPEAMRKLGAKITEECVQRVATSFRPRRIFFASHRSWERVRDGLWSISDGQSTVQVCLLPVVAAESIPPASPQVLFLTLGESRPLEEDFADLVTQRSRIGGTIHPLLREVLDEFTTYGIRFAWHADASEPGST